MNRFRVFTFLLILAGCSTPPAPVLKVKEFDPERAATLARDIEKTVTPALHEGLQLHLWAIDSLISDPVSIDVDDEGRLYYTRTVRQKNSEFDIRGHQSWEIESIAIQSIEEKRAFLRRVLAPENSSTNTWLADLNGDGSHDWRDMTVQKEEVYLVEDRSGDGIADRSQLFIGDFQDEVTDAAGGVLKFQDKVFVAIGPDLWSLTDDNKDGAADQKKSLSHGYGIHVGFSGHGMSGLEVGPEGKIYWQIGDIGFHGTDATGKEWNHANSGVICRAYPDGSEFEVFSYGNRNTHEFVFDEYGNLISEDNDGDHAGESERIVYIPEGADLGWRINWQFGKYRDPKNNDYKVWMAEKMHIPAFQGQPAYIVPPIANFVNGPTGMLYNPGGALGPEWKNHFFVVEFVGNPAQSGIHSFKLQPAGASFTLGETRKVLGGILPTGIDFGPDGAMYVADWIDGWGTKDYGRVWKLDVAQPDLQLRQTLRTILLTPEGKASLADLESWLKVDDYRVRQKAQFELASRKEGLEIFSRVLADRTHQLARVHAIWGIRQVARFNSDAAKVLTPYLKDADPEIRAQAARWLGDLRYQPAAQQLLPLLKDQARVQFFAAEALGKLRNRAAIAPLVDLLAVNNNSDVLLRHGASLALANIGDTTALVNLSTHPAPAVRMGAVLALRRLRNSGIRSFLKDADEDVVTEVARAINDDHSIPGALAALGEALVNSPVSREAFVRRAINANLRTGTPRAMEILLQYAQQASSPAPMRAEALAALSTWAKPSVLDRVDGRYRGRIVRDSVTLIQVAGQGVTLLSQDKAPLVRLAAIRAIGQWKYAQAYATLAKSLRTEPDATNRAAILESLYALNNPGMQEFIALGLRDKDRIVRVKALDILPKIQIEPATAVALLMEVIRKQSVPERQTAVEALGNLPQTATTQALEELLNGVLQGKLPAEIQLELSDALEKTSNREGVIRMRNFLRSQSSDTVMAAHLGALTGGNADKGAGIFYGHPVAQCIRCHALWDYGGNAGPQLNGIGTRLSRYQLLEALVKPSARISPGYAIVSVELVSGAKVNGAYLGADDNELRLRITRGEQTLDTVIRKSDIRKQTEPISSMPPMGTLLTKKEIRDVLEFLANQR